MSRNKTLEITVSGLCFLLFLREKEGADEESSGDCGQYFGSAGFTERSVDGLAGIWPSSRWEWVGRMESPQ